MQFGKGRGRGGGHRAPRADYNEVSKHNELFEQYYNEVGVITEDERDEFWDALGRDLPNSFRFAGSKGYVEHLLAIELMFTIVQTCSCSSTALERSLHP